MSAAWNTVVARRVVGLREAYRSVDDVPAGLIKAGLNLLDGVAGAVSAVARPAVAHLDVYLPNILLDVDGGFRCLLDLEHLRWVDPVMDFVKPAMWMFPDQPSWAEAFEDGYREAGLRPAGWSERLSVATGLELLTGVEYWTRVADHALLWIWVMPWAVNPRVRCKYPVAMQASREIRRRRSAVGVPGTGAALFRTWHGLGPAGHPRVEQMTSHTSRSRGACVIDLAGTL